MADKNFAGVSVTFFVGALRLLGEVHGERSCARIEELRRALEQTERIWIESPEVSKSDKARAGDGD